MTDKAPGQKVELSVKANGAYRIRLIGPERDQRQRQILIGDEKATLSLLPGRYTALVESVSSTGKSEPYVFDVERSDSSSPQAVILDEDPDQARSSQPCRAVRPSEVIRKPEVLGFDLTAPNEPRPHRESVAIRVGVLCVTSPGQSEELRGNAFTVAGSTDPESNGVRLVVTRAPQWRSYPRWLLTIVVDGLAARCVRLPLFCDGLQVVLRPVQGPTGPDVSLSMRPQDETVATFVGAMTQAFPSEIEKILKVTGQASSIDYFAKDRDDPWAASAAALLHARIGTIDRVSTSVASLAEECLWLPDASVASAWARVAVASKETLPDQEESALSDLINARRFGPIYFATANTLAAQMLTTLSISAQKKSTCQKARTESDFWNRLNRQAMRAGAFFTWEVLDSSFEEGFSSMKDYSIILSGRLSPDQIDFSAGEPIRVKGTTDRPDATRQLLWQPEMADIGRTVYPTLIERKITKMMVGESLVGEGNEVAHIDLLIGPRGSAAELAFTSALVNNKAGFTTLLAVVAPNLLAKPNTILFNKVTIKGAKQAVQMFGPAQAGVAKAVVDSVAEGVIPISEADDLFICVGVFIHWDASDDQKIQDFNYRATKEAIARAIKGEPKAPEVVARRKEAKHPFAAN
jgi:5,6,7,8-tetrahydromethanopterin hydro-lyase